MVLDQLQLAIHILVLYQLKLKELLIILCLKMNLLLMMEIQRTLLKCLNKE